MNKQLEALISRAKHIVENGGLLARDTSLALIAALEQAQQPQASPLAVKLPEPEQWDICQVLLCRKKVIEAIRAAGGEVFNE